MRKSFVKQLTFIAAVLLSSFSVSAVETGAANIDFSEGTFEGWKMETGYYYRGEDGVCVYEWNDDVTEPNDRFKLQNFAISKDDPIIVCDGFLTNPFTNGSVTLRIGVPGYNKGAETNGELKAAAERSSYSFVVTEKIKELIVDYACVIDDPNDGANKAAEHGEGMNPYFGMNVEFLSPSGELVSVPNSQFDSYSSLKNMNKPTKPCVYSEMSDRLSDYYYLPWTSVSYDLADKVGYQVTITFQTHDCLKTSGGKEEAGGHEAYGYFHVETKEVENSNIPKLRQSTVEYCEGYGKGKVDLSLTEGDASDYIIKWWFGKDTLDGFSIGQNRDESFFENLPSDSGSFLYQVVDKNTGEKGDVYSFEVIVNNAPDAPKLEKLQYTINGVGKETVSTEDFKHDLDANYTLLWFTSDDSEKEPNSEGTPYVSIDRTTESEYMFYIAYKDGDCYSERTPVYVEVLSASVPVVDDIAICQGNTFDFNDAARAEDGYDLVWFIDPVDTIGRGMMTPPTNFVDVETPGLYTFYVAQRSKTAPYTQSDLAKVRVSVYGVKEPIVNDVKYCANDVAAPLEASFEEDRDKYYFADEIVYVVGSAETVAPIVPNTQVLATTRYTYSAYQTYTIPISGEICKGNSVEVNVDVIAVGRPMINGNVVYSKLEVDANNGYVDILEKNPNLIDVQPGMELLWSKDENGIYFKGSSSSSKPSYSETIIGTEYQTRWVKMVSEEGCESEPAMVNIIIDMPLYPEVNNISICENDLNSVPAEKEPANNAKVMVNNGSLVNAREYKLYWFTNESDAEAAVKDPTALMKGSAVAPTFNEMFASIDMSDMESKWETYLYVVQSDGEMTSIPVEMKLTVYVTPRLSALAHDPVCNVESPVDLSYWFNITNVMGVMFSVSYEGSNVSPAAITKAGIYTVEATTNEGCKSDPLDIMVDIRNLSIKIDPEVKIANGGNVTNEVKVDYSYDKTVAGDVKLEWNSTETTSDILSQNGIIDADATEFEYVSGNFDGDEGSIYSIRIKVSDGVCTSIAMQNVVVGNSAVESISSDSEDSIVNVYTASGALIKSKVKRSEALSGLEDGVYLVGGEKVVVKK